MHTPQLLQFKGSIYATVPLIFVVFLASNVTALVAAACACAIDSSIGFGACANPQINTPSVAQSTGLSLTCASIKKPSSLRVTLYICASGFFFGGIMADARTRRSGLISIFRLIVESVNLILKSSLSLSTLNSLLTSYLKKRMPFFPGFSVQVFAQSITAHISVKNKNVHFRIEFFELQSVFYRMGTACF